MHPILVSLDSVFLHNYKTEFLAVDAVRSLTVLDRVLCVLLGCYLISIPGDTHIAILTILCKMIQHHHIAHNQSITLIITGENFLVYVHLCRAFGCLWGTTCVVGLGSVVQGVWGETYHALIVAARCCIGWNQTLAYPV